MKPYAMVLLLGIAVPGVVASRLDAQANGARIDGIVSDSQSLPLPGVKLVLMETGTDLTRTTETTTAGTYQFPSLNPGQYELRVEAPGFATEVRKLTLEVDQELRLDVTPRSAKYRSTSRWWARWTCCAPPTRASAK